MIKILGRILKRAVVSTLIIYGLDVILSVVNFSIPLNIITISQVAFLGVPGLLTLIAMYFIL